MADSDNGPAKELGIFRGRARLFVMNATAWAYAGSGEIKLLYGTTTLKTRIVMRDGSTQKVLMNHFVQPEAELRAAPSEADERNRAFSFTADDGATGVHTKQVFAVRFKAESAAREFEASYKQAQTRNERSEELAAADGSSFPLTDVSVGSAAAPPVFGVSTSPLPGILESPPSSAQSSHRAAPPTLSSASAPLHLPAEIASPSPTKVAPAAFKTEPVPISQGSPYKAAAVAVTPVVAVVAPASAPAAAVPTPTPAATAPQPTDASAGGPASVPTTVAAPAPVPVVSPTAPLSKPFPAATPAALLSKPSPAAEAQLGSSSAWVGTTIAVVAAVGIGAAVAVLLREQRTGGGSLADAATRVGRNAQSLFQRTWKGLAGGTPAVAAAVVAPVAAAPAIGRPSLAVPAARK